MQMFSSYGAPTGEIGITIIILTKMKKNNNVSHSIIWIYWRVADLEYWITDPHHAAAREGAAVVQANDHEENVTKDVHDQLAEDIEHRFSQDQFSGQ